MRGGNTYPERTVGPHILSRPRSRLHVLVETPVKTGGRRVEFTAWFNSWGRTPSRLSVYVYYNSNVSGLV